MLTSALHRFGGSGNWYVLCRLMLANIHLVYQSQYGTAAKKPTFFSGWRSDSFEHNLNRFHAPVCPEQIQAVSGRNADGSYKTAVGKEYPSPYVPSHCH